MNDFQSDLNRRNTETVRLALIDMQTRLQRQDDLILKQQQAIGTLNNRLVALETQLNQMRVGLVGHGPSVT